MRYLLILGLGLCWFSANAQQPSGVAQYFATARTDPGILAARSKVEFLTGTDHRLPLVQELEFRTETHDFLLEEQEYTLRFSPNTPALQRRQEAYHQAVVALTEAQDRPLLLEALEPKYRTVVDYHFLPRLLESQRRTLEIYRQQLSLLRQQVVTADFDLNDLVATETDIFETEEELLDLQQAWSVADEAIRAFRNDTLLTDLLKVEALGAIVRTTALPAPMEAEVLRLRRELLRSDYERELAAINNPLDFVQARYGGRNSDAFREEFSVGLGLRLPVKGDKKLDLLELEYEQEERHADFQLEQLEREKEIAEAARAVRFGIERYELLRQQNTDSQTEFALRQLEQLSDSDPLQILRLRLLLHRRQQRLLELRYRLYRDYVDWLVLTETMVALPLRNWLSEELSVF